MSHDKAKELLNAVENSPFNKHEKIIPILQELLCRIQKLEAKVGLSQATWADENSTVNFVNLDWEKAPETPATLAKVHRGASVCRRGCGNRGSRLCRGQFKYCKNKTI